MAEKTALIIGGTGQIGQAVAQNLLRSGWNVSLTHRGNSKIPESLTRQGAKSIIHDRQNDRLGDAIGSGADIVIDTIAYDANHGQQLLEIQDDVGAFIVISSSSVYCDEKGRSLDEAVLNGFPDIPEAMTESQSTLPPGDDNYSTKKSRSGTMPAGEIHVASHHSATMRYSWRQFGPSSRMVVCKADAGRSIRNSFGL